MEITKADVEDMALDKLLTVALRKRANQAGAKLQIRKATKQLRNGEYLLLGKDIKGYSVSVQGDTEFVGEILRKMLYEHKLTRGLDTP